MVWLAGDLPYSAMSLDPTYLMLIAENKASALVSQVPVINFHHYNSFLLTQWLWLHGSVGRVSEYLNFSMKLIDYANLN